MIATLTDFDAADWLKSAEAVREYLVAAAEEGDVPFLIDSLSVVSRAKGFDAFAQEIGADAGALRRKLAGEGGPDGLTLLEILGAIGWGLKTIPTSRAQAA